MFPNALAAEQHWDRSFVGRVVADSFVGALMLFDTDLRYRFAGGTNLGATGWTRDQLEGHTIWEAFPAGTANVLEPVYRSALTGEAASFDINYDGRTYCTDVVPVRDGGGSAIVGGMVTTRDVTIEREISRALDEAQETFRMAFANAPIGMVIVELDGRYRSVNRALCDISGYSEAEMRARGFAELIEGDDVRVSGEQLAVLHDGRSSDVEVQLRHARGHLVWVVMSASLVTDSTGAPLFFIGQVQDITERKRQEHVLRHQAERDSLTGLWNRHRFEQELSRSRALADRGGETGAVLLLDLDGLKVINDTYGHRCGDDALRRVGEVIAAGVRDSDVACRYGGDEFAVILPNTRGDVAVRLSERLLADIARQRLVVGECVVAISASAGIAEITRGVDPVAEADTALYDVKRARRT
ncbi:MAG: diguanylate cyclase [Ilumatobacteraceae bacterium]